MKTRIAVPVLLAVVTLGLTACVPGYDAAPPRHPVSGTVDETASPTTGTGDVLTDDATFGALERRFGARLGVVAIDTGTGDRVAYRADERFAFASTHKALSAAAVLDATTDAELDETITWSQSDVVSNSPVTSQHVSTGLPLRTVVAAAVQQSDNTAANLMFERIGGPAGLTAFVASKGDHVTRSDRLETSLNDATPGDDRDTSTPAAMARDLRLLAVDDGLSADDRATLVDWLRGSQTGSTLVAAGLPAGWTTGDKSGGGGYGTRNDIAVAWPDDGGAPLVFAVLSDRRELGAGAPTDDALVAEAARAAFDALRPAADR